MSRLTDYTTYADAQRYFAADKLWELFDGNRERLNIAHECIDRYAAVTDRAAIIVAHADGRDESLSFAEISRASSQFANCLIERGVQPGDRVAVMLEPSKPFYVAIFGAMKMGAIAVPLFTLFGPDGVRLRVKDCAPRLLVTNTEKAALAASIEGPEVLIADADFMTRLASYPDTYKPSTRADDFAIYQYTSGTTRELPEAVRHTHRSIVTLMVAALYGTGLRPGDRFFCPSSPAWGHGLWHGTLAPLALGLTIGAYAGKVRRRAAAEGTAGSPNHEPVCSSDALPDDAQLGRGVEVSVFNSQTVVHRRADRQRDRGVRRGDVRHPVCSMYGTTEIGVILVNYPGASDLPVKPGSLGKPIPGGRVEVHDAAGVPCEPGVTGELKVWRKGAWIATKDLGRDRCRRIFLSRRPRG